MADGGRAKKGVGSFWGYFKSSPNIQTKVFNFWTMRYEGEIDGTAIFSYLLNPSLESVVGQVVSGCVGFDSVLLLTKKIDQNFFALLN